MFNFFQKLKKQNSDDFKNIDDWWTYGDSNNFYRSVCQETTVEKEIFSFFTYASRTCLSTKTIKDPNLIQNRN